MKVVLGNGYKDSITQFSGIATARAEYLDGVPKVLIEGHNVDGKSREQWFAERRLKPVEEINDKAYA